MTEAGVQSTNSSFNTQASDEKPPKHTELHRLKTEYGYMRFGRRSEGVKSLCGIFGKARKDYGSIRSFWYVFFQFFISNFNPFFLALMEYH